jgi:putative membrane protein
MCLLMMWWPNGGMSGGGWMWMAIGMVVFWGLLITGGVLLFRTLGRSAGRPVPVGQRSPGQLLAERFALGEIDEDEYERRLTALAAASSGAA